MKSISKLKDEARRYEQREEWEKAIQAYLQVLHIAEEGETEVELPLYNRLGDLCVRLGKPQEAVRHYEQAADRYAEAGLYNNAIALCNKALRYSPDRLELIRKLGQFSASQGFITDARRYFLDYAERQFNAGKVSEALNALEDFANVSDDADVREMLGRQLHAHGRINDAVDELRRAFALRTRDGQTEQAAALREEILAIDPHAQLEGGAPASSGGQRAPEPVDLPGLVEIEPDRPDVPFDDPVTTGVEGLETGALPGEDAGQVDAVELAGFESTGQSDDLSEIDLTAAEGIEGLETTSLDFREVDPETPVLEDLGLDREETSFDGQSGSPDAGSFDLPTLDDPSAGFDLPTVDDADETFDLPTLDEPETDLPTLDEPQAEADLPLLDDSSDIVHLPDGDDAAAFDLPLLGDDDPVDVENEATPTPPPQIDDPSALDMPGEDPSADFGLGGDLPLDLSSLSGGMFDLTPKDEDTSAAPDWTTDETSFDIPNLDDDALGLSTWEPEPDATFDLPLSDSELDEVAPEEETPPADAEQTVLPPSHEQPEEPETTEPPAPERPDPGRQATTAAEAAAAIPPDAMQIPAIELPTWDTGVPSDDAELAAGAIEGAAPQDAAPEDAAPSEMDALEDVESTEPAWVDLVTEEEDDISAELPTFTYEDERSAEADVPFVGDDEDMDTIGTDPADLTTGAAEPDDDPLGLAAHLAGMSTGAAQRNVPPAEPQTTAEAGDTDWLDEIADETEREDAAASSDAAEAAATLDEGGADAETSDAGLPAASLEDAGAAARDAEDAAREMAAAPPPRGSQPPSALPAGEDYIDLGAFLTGDGEDESTRFRVQETAPTGDEDRDFAELLSQFKAKVQEHLPPEDAAAHYDLGLAFKEMGLIDEAIGEFQIALRAGHMRLQVYEELGQCFLQKEQFNIAEKVLSRALTMKFDDELELLGVYYHLGRAYEALGRRDQARDAYERVLGMDINFGDVTDRLARL